MKRFLIAALLTGATPGVAYAQVSLPVIGWTVSPGRSTTGNKICTLFGGFGEHSDLAWVTDSTSPPQHVTFVFDDGGALPRARVSVSRLTVSTHGTARMSISGTMKFGEFRTSLDGRTSDSLLHLFAANRSMTVALEGQRPVLVNLAGSADAAQSMRRCEAVRNGSQRPAATLRIPAATRHTVKQTNRAKPAAPTTVAALARPLPADSPAPSTLPAPAPATPPATAAVSPPTPAAQLALNDSLLLAKAIEGQFLDIVQDGAASYENTSDGSLSQGARKTRATDFCTLLGSDKEASNWTGTIAGFSSNSHGGVALAVKLADGVTLGTTDNGLANSTYTSTIDPRSDLFKTISRMHVGEPVTFSGTFYASDPDCIKETSPTQSRSMTSPNFLFDFATVDPQS